jgi:hypothetical protein
MQTVYNLEDHWKSSEKWPSTRVLILVFVAIPSNRTPCTYHSMYYILQRRQNRNMEQMISRFTRQRLFQCTTLWRNIKSNVAWNWFVWNPRMKRYFWAILFDVNQGTVSSLAFATSIEPGLTQNKLVQIFHNVWLGRSTFS